VAAKLERLSPTAKTYLWQFLSSTIRTMQCTLAGQYQQEFGDPVAKGQSAKIQPRNICDYQASGVDNVVSSLPDQKAIA